MAEHKRRELSPLGRRSVRVHRKVSLGAAAGDDGLANLQLRQWPHLRANVFARRHPGIPEQVLLLVLAHAIHNLDKHLAPAAWQLNAEVARHDRVDLWHVAVAHVRYGDQLHDHEAQGHRKGAALHGRWRVHDALQRHRLRFHVLERLLEHDHLGLEPWELHRLLSELERLLRPVGGDG